MDIYESIVDDDSSMEARVSRIISDSSEECSVTLRDVQQIEQDIAKGTAVQSQEVLTTTDTTPTKWRVCLDNVKDNLLKLVEIVRPKFRLLSLLMIILAWNAYLIAGIAYHLTNDIYIDVCAGLGFLLLLSAVVYSVLLSHYLIIPLFGKYSKQCCLTPFRKVFDFLAEYRYIYWLGFAVFLLICTVFLAFDTLGHRERLKSIIGVFIFLILSLLASEYPSKINFSHVSIGLAIQVILCLTLIRLPPGFSAIDCLGNKLETVVKNSIDGNRPIIGPTAFTEDTIENRLDISPHFRGIIFKAIPAIIFAAVLLEILNYLKVKKVLAEKLAVFYRKTLGTSKAESLAGAANIFVGNKQSIVYISAYLMLLTKSELHCFMVGSFSTITGADMATLIAMDVRGAYLLLAGIISSPGALGIAKTVYPETKHSVASSLDIGVKKSQSISYMGAASRGILRSVKVIGILLTQIMAGLSMVTVLNHIVEWMFQHVGLQGISFEWLLGYAFYPIAWLIGIETSSCHDVGKALGLKLIGNEYLAYISIMSRKHEGKISQRTELLATLSLYGPANLCNTAMLMAVLVSIVPGRRKDASEVMYKALFCGFLSSLMSAAIAGLFINF